MKNILFYSMAVYCIGLSLFSYYQSKMQLEITNSYIKTGDSLRHANYSKAWELGFRNGYQANSITNKVQLKKQHYKDSVAFTKLLK